MQMNLHHGETVFLRRGRRFEKGEVSKLGLPGKRYKEFKMAGIKQNADALRK